jgi:carbonic anhydrase
MKAIDYIYRFDAENPTAKPLPPNADMARKTLEQGNQMFAQWMESCQHGAAGEGESRYIVPCNGLEVGMIRMPSAFPKPSPFAVVVGCSDARVPTEMLFGQGFNDLFVIRVAGNVLGDECMGSIDFAINALSESVKVIVMLGHSGCGAVTGAVDSYLNPLKFWSKSTSMMLRSILQRILVAVREAANGLETVWGADIREHPHFREVLIDSSVAINAAQTAYNLHVEVERAGKWEIDVLYGVFNLFNHRVVSPARLNKSAGDNAAGLAFAPTNPRDFKTLAIELAKTYEDRLFGHEGGSNGHPHVQVPSLVQIVEGNGDH